MPTDSTRPPPSDSSPDSAPREADQPPDDAEKRRPEKRRPGDPGNAPGAAEPDPGSAATKEDEGAEAVEEKAGEPGEDDASAEPAAPKRKRGPKRRARPSARTRARRGDDDRDKEGERRHSARRSKRPRPAASEANRGILPRLLTIVMALSVVAIIGGSRCQSWFAGGSAGLLAGLRPQVIQGMRRVQVLNDGQRAADGDHWDSNLTGVFTSRRSYVQYDLGSSKPIRAAYLHGDNNDEYVISVSEDGKQFKTIWRAMAVRASGARARHADNLQGQGRYVRIGVARGDNSYSVTEVQLFEERPTIFPPRLAVGRGLPAGEQVRGDLTLFALAVAFFLFTTSRHSSRLWLGASLLIPVVAGYGLYRTLGDNWPVGGREVAFVRATTALLAVLAILREVLFSKRFPANRVVVVGALAIAGMGAFMAFFNLGHPQFEDHKNHRDLYVHNFDMRVYYPVAKYFDELRYDGLYQASVAAYAADDPNSNLDTLKSVELRDLRNHRMTRVEQVKDQIRAVQRRFTPERWQEFVADMRYFRETMGRRDYLGSMRDHGGNATPVWLGIAHLIFAYTQASNTTLLIGGLLDPLMLLLTFIVIGRTFGIRTMFVSMVIWGANDFYMFGSNWAGATLRHDWMVYLALGVCALKTKRWLLAGALLALSASIRAFPALALVGVLLPAIWWLWDYRRVKEKWPSWKLVKKHERPVLLTLAGAAAGSVVLFLFSSLLFSFDAWFEWLAKVRLLDRDPHVNHVSLRALVAGSDHLQLSVLRARMPVFVAAIALCVAAVALAARNRRMDHAAIFGALLIPVVFNPANYYIHFLFILPLLAFEVRRGQARGRRLGCIGLSDAGIWWPMLIVCVAQYWTTLEKDLELHFQYSTALFFAGAIGMMAVVLWRDRKVAFADLLPELPKSTGTEPAGDVSARKEPAEDAPVEGSMVSDESPAEQKPASEVEPFDEAGDGSESDAGADADAADAEPASSDAANEADAAEDDIPIRSDRRRSERKD